jgi:tetratricopeptide (TPR) repeat protein
VGEATRLKTEVSRADYLFTQFRVIATYIRLLFLPVNQNLDYDYPVFHSLLNPQVILSSVFLVSIFGIGIYLTYSSMSRDAALRLAAFGIFWFFTALSVESSIIPIREVIFEHRLYLPGGGVVVSAVTLLFVASNRLAQRWKRAEKMLVPVFIVLVVALVSTTHARNGVWRSEVSLWEDVVRKAPENGRGHNNLGNAYGKIGDYDRAFVHLERALSLKPYYPVAYNGLGNAYNAKGLSDKAIENYQAAIELNPDYELAHFNLGLVYIQKGLMDKARQEFETVLAINPNHSKVRPFLRYIDNLKPSSDNQ